MIKDKTLGQVFHEAFIARLHECEPTINGQVVTFGSWDECTESYKEDVEAAARAVAIEAVYRVLRVSGDKVLDAIDAVMPTQRQRQEAVIEAARRLASTIDIRDCIRGDLQSDVVFAVEALDALKKK